MNEKVGTTSLAYFGNDKEVRKALHVREGTVKKFEKTNDPLRGDHDFTFPYVGQEQWIKSLNLPIESPWNPWFLNNQVAGYETKYVKNGYSLTHTIVKGAGHSIPLFKPKEAWAILDAWLTSHSYVSDS
ncbi:hypothetical protein L1987_54087 [Smallanthus sonchifolius]|uniref:Uncharacterized protein n=1 Tax=Smallanthus sonchifolius TaxID=185202 RepID=A0ACB9E627_9ASTR|nr:hypothetical protein L1987_54087 [Smallanthus sonchifolius]